MKSSEPIVLIPGLLCSARLFSKQIPALWPHGPVTIADHRRGDTVEALATQVLTDAPPRFALAGLSMGGYIAMTVWRMAPERVTRLALLNCSAGADRPERSAARRELISLAENGRFAEIVDRHLPTFLHRQRQHDAALVAEVRAMAAEVGAEAYARQQRANMARPDMRPILPGIACPSLVLVAGDDELIPPALSREMADLIPDVRIIEIPGCGHLSTLEQPEAVNAALLAWLGWT